MPLHACSTSALFGPALLPVTALQHAMAFAQVAETEPAAGALWEAPPRGGDAPTRGAARQRAEDSRLQAVRRVHRRRIHRVLVATSYLGPPLIFAITRGALAASVSGTSSRLRRV